MKTSILIFASLLSAQWLQAQNSSIPDVDLRDIDGKIISSSQISEPGKATLLVFWETTSGECCDNLDKLQGAWEDKLSRYDIHLVAICVDCNGNWMQVKPIINGNGWDFDTYIDVNGDLRRAMGIGETPCTLLYDASQALVCRYNSACSGSEEFLCNSILERLHLDATAENLQAGR